MTRKQLEQAICLISMFDNFDIPIETINYLYRLELTEETTREQVLTAYLIANNIQLESDDTSKKRK